MMKTITHELSTIYIFYIIYHIDNNFTGGGSTIIIQMRIILSGYIPPIDMTISQHDKYNYCY